MTHGGFWNPSTCEISPLLIDLHKFILGSNVIFGNIGGGI